MMSLLRSAVMAPVKAEPGAEELAGPAPSTATPPPKRRALDEQLSDPKPPLPAEKRRCLRGPAAAGSKEAPAPELDPEAELDFAEQLERHGVPASGRARLLPLLRRWGPARTAQILGLWTFLGDGATRPPATSALQVWGPAGAGKSEIVLDYMRKTGIRHVRLNCACLFSLGDLQARLAEEVRRSAASAAAEADVCGEVPRDLQQRMPPGRQLRAIDRLEAMLERPLEQLRQIAEDANASVPGSAKRSDKVVVVFDNAQLLPRLGPNAIELLLSLREVLRHGRQIVPLFIGRLLLSSLGASPETEPPQVAFPQYSAEEAEAVLIRALSARLLQRRPDCEEALMLPTESDVRQVVSSGLLKMGAPFVGINLGELLWIGDEVLATPQVLGASLATLQARIEALVEERLGICDQTSLLLGSDEDAAAGAAARRMEPAVVAAKVTMHLTTKEEQRLMLAAYLASRIDKDDDQQLFMPEGRRRMKRRGAVTKGQRQGQVENDAPPFLRPPRPVALARLLAIYHRLAREKQALGAPLLEQLMNLREAGLIRFVGNRPVNIDRDPKVVCRVELPLARVVARELGVDLAEYLCSL